MRTPWLVLTWLLSALFLGWWVAHNPLPDGFQNEYIHVGNAYALWAAATEGDQWTLRWIAYTGYWPFGFQLASWPGLLIMDTSRMALLTANLWHLGLLLWACSSLGRAFGARWTPIILLLCPGVFGSLVRYEPNLANIAWVAAGLACLVGSRGLSWGLLGSPGLSWAVLPRNYGTPHLRQRLRGLGSLKLAG